MTDLSRLMIGLGIALLALGLILAFANRLHLPFGRLPGDLTWRGRHTTVFFPLATSLLLSALLSLIFWVASRFR